MLRTISQSPQFQNGAGNNELLSDKTIWLMI